MDVFYRISDAGYKKIKPDYINNETCLNNFVTKFANMSNIKVIADNVSDDTYNMICKYVDKENITKVSIGHGAGTFNLALDMALKLPSLNYVYFVENDYLHKDDSWEVLREGIHIGFPYVTLYDHIDKYIPKHQGGNPFIESDGGEHSKVYLTKSCHWKITNSTTMTFASTVKDLQQDEPILRKWTTQAHPHDFNMFLELGKNNRYCISSVPGYATHGELKWLAPLTNWEEVALTNRINLV